MRDYGTLVDYGTAVELRPATMDELLASLAAAHRDGGAGVINVDERNCYVTGDDVIEPMLDALRLAAYDNESVRVVTISKHPDEWDAGNMWAIATAHETIISDNDSLPSPEPCERPYAVVSWDGGVVTGVPLDSIRLERRS